MNRHLQRGAGRLKLVLSLLILGLFAYGCIKIVPAYVNDYQLEDAMKTEARFAAVNHKSPEDVREAVFRKIRELEIPASREDIRVEPLGGGGVRISVTYRVIVDLPGYQLKLDFQPKADNMSI